jgi:hypothetical protein
MIVLAFLLLERHVGASTALVCCAPMVFAPAAYNHFIQQGFRQWALTTFVAAAYAFDRGRESARWAFFGGLLFFFMLYLDLFTLQAAPALALFALSCLVLGERWRTRVLAAAGGAALSGAFFLWVRRGLPGAPPTQLELSRLPGNVKLLIDQCGPWIIGARALWAPAGGQLRPWNAPAPVVVLQWSGAALLLVAVTFPVFAFIRWWRPGAGPIAPATKFVGLLGSLTIAASVGGFLFSTWPVDLASVRYLALGAVAVPFALRPLLARVRPRDRRPAHRRVAGIWGVCERSVPGALAARGGRRRACAARRIARPRRSRGGCRLLALLSLELALRRGSGAGEHRRLGADARLPCRVQSRAASGPHLPSFGAANAALAV